MRYIEVVGGIGAGRCDLELIGGDSVTGYIFHTGYSSRVLTNCTRKDVITGWTCYRGEDGIEVVNIGDFTRENVEKYLYSSGGPEDLPIYDFHAVFDDIDIPWATKEGRDCYQRIMERARLKRR